ncbi:hypothetical protein [Roseobacter sp.]|uniref:hypothetical protein n=1 Tax=Roseobacter sp. TaxID=1907202 RepID=UPI002965D0D2|nr:hypothetical protein [Roseobacter sp.]MDW3181800.1 hypothetical protein [Roseobacter sp.]
MKDIAKIAQTHITRITPIVAKDGPERSAFLAFLEELHDDLNPEITEAEVIEMLAQHLIIRPVFDALFKGSRYLQLLDQKRSNPRLDEQVRALKRFSFERGAIIVMISQIDRAFERSSGGTPSIHDIRLPNPVDLSLFDKRCFLHDGEVRIEMAA